MVNKAQGMILKSLEALEPGEKENILNKMQGAETSDIAEQNQVIVTKIMIMMMIMTMMLQVLMLLLKASCEVAQESHQHLDQVEAVYCTVLYCTVLYCIVLYCILYCTVLHPIYITTLITWIGA